MIERVPDVNGQAKYSLVMVRCQLLVLVGWAFFLAPSVRVFAQSAGDLPAYRQAGLPVEQRVSDLLSRMTVEEKARQLDMYSGSDDLLAADQKVDKTHAKADAVFDPALAAKALGTLGPGPFTTSIRGPNFTMPFRPG
jgi:hypothetical protein